ncbi:helix-turn-helix domain-containing protein [Microbacterium azadirachtae]|uniref:helix-turn-helix domain-containing protein n=1 Tax=Microbacterium azadirachtae TaxID=582680 RepID=UPI0012E0AFA0|nr:hypothetical protein [Microbacterium azadirachtae]
MAGAIDLCSNHWRTGLSLEELRDLAQAGNRDIEPIVRTIYRPHPLPERLGPRKVADIVRRYQEGESARSLAEKYKVAPSAVTRLLRENNVVVKKRTVTEAEARRIAKEYEAGATMRDIEKNHGLSHGAVSRTLHRVGVEMRASAPRRKAV